jgi:hypothetical protein
MAEGLGYSLASVDALSGQTFGRVVSLLLDGIPSGRVWPMFILEALGGAALLVVRPSAPMPSPDDAR